jgi:hypothetical protein
MTDIPRPDPRIVAHHQQLLDRLFRELLETEQSTAVHAAREARRLTGAPAEAMAALCDHAEATSRALVDFARNERLPERPGGRAVVRIVAAVRRAIADRLVDRERSYRGTLLEIRHGVDVVRMLRHVADASGRVDIGGFCTRWLDEREPLITAAEHAMNWFSHHPAAATQLVVIPDLLRRRSRRIIAATAT